MPDRKLQVGVKAVIEDDQGRVLLMKKAYAHVSEKKASWDIPGGRIEPGETLHEALARELQEETGMELVAVKQILYVQDILSNPELHVVRVTYLVTAKGDITISDEHAGYEWFRRDEIPPAEQTDGFFIEAAHANGWL